MTDTTTPAELHVPEAAADLYFACGCSESGRSRAGYQSDALPIIVAAELRRLAEQLGQLGSCCESGSGDLAALRARADELDPQ